MKFASASAWSIVVIGLLAIAGDAAATYPGKNGRIAYSIEFESGSQIKTLDPRNGQTRNVRGLCPVYWGCTDSLPSWAPDGRRLLFGGEPLSSNQLLTAIVLTNAKRHPLTDFQTGAWSPDGRRVAVTRGDGVYTVNPQGGEVRHILKARSPDVHDWSSKNRIVFTSLSGIATIRPDGTGLKRIPSRSAQRPSFSPDGRRIAYDRLTGRGSQMRIMRSDGKFDHAIRSRPRGLHPTWSPDGKLIAYTADAFVYSSQQRVFTIRPDGSRRRLIYELPRSNERPTATIRKLSWQPRPRR